MPVFTYDEQIFSDLYKDVNGFRPSSHEFYDATPERKQVIWDSLLEDLDYENKRIESMHVNAIERFEKKIVKTIKLGASDRESAIRWLMDAFDVDGDEDYLKYHFCLPYSYNLLSGKSV